MKQIVRYRFMTVPNKLYGDVRITVDEQSRAEVKSTYEGGRSTNIVLLPMVNIQILKPFETGEDGRRFRPMSSMNDSIGLTKFSYPIFLNELKGIYDGMKTPSLYSYTGNRLELNDKEAEKIRRVFMIGRTNVELKAVVIEQPNDTGVTEMLEGIKMKFNNEESTMLLTLRDIESMIWVLDKLDIDSIVLTMYTSFIDRVPYTRSKSVIDIQPMSHPVAEQNTVTPVVEKKKKEAPVTQETVINVPAEKYANFDNVSADDFAKYMNPPVEPDSTSAV